MGITGNTDLSSVRTGKENDLSLVQDVYKLQKFIWTKTTCGCEDT